MERAVSPQRHSPLLHASSEPGQARTRLGGAGVVAGGCARCTRAVAGARAPPRLRAVRACARQWASGQGATGSAPRQRSHLAALSPRRPRRVLGAAGRLCLSLPRRYAARRPDGGGDADRLTSHNAAQEPLYAPLRTRCPRFRQLCPSPVPKGVAAGPRAAACAARSAMAPSPLRPVAWGRSMATLRRRSSRSSCRRSTTTNVRSSTVGGKSRGVGDRDGVPGAGWPPVCRAAALPSGDLLEGVPGDPRCRHQRRGARASSGPADADGLSGEPWLSTGIVQPRGRVAARCLHPTPVEGEGQVLPYDNTVDRDTVFPCAAPVMETHRPITPE